MGLLRRRLSHVLLLTWLGVVVLLFLAISFLLIVVLVSFLTSLVGWGLTVEGGWLSIVGHWLVHHVGWNLTVSWESVPVRVLGLWGQVLVWVEPTEGHDVSQAGQLDHWRSHLLGRVVLGLVVTFFILGVLLLLVVLKLVWHWWKGHTVWKIWKWINESSLFIIVVEE